MSERDRFEEWARDYLMRTEPMAGSIKVSGLTDWLRHDLYNQNHYTVPWTESAWTGWQAAIEDDVVERGRSSSSALARRGISLSKARKT